MATKEELGPIIIDTLKLTIKQAASKIKEGCNLEFITEEEIIEAIRPFRTSRKGLETCCEAVIAINRRKNLIDGQLDLREESDWSGVLGSMGIGGRFRP
jgi:hypothetical protein